MRNAKRKLGIAGLLLSGIATLSPVQAQEKEPVVLDNFDYASHRDVPAIDGRSYKGVIFNYNLLSDARISQSDKKNVHIEPIWFYDIDNDGKFGKAEMNAIKAGIPIFMHQEFNDIANEKIRKFLEVAGEYSTQKGKREETDSQKYEARIKELEQKILEYQSQILKPEGAEKEKIPKEKGQKDKRGFSLFLQQTANGNFDAYTTSLGARFNPFKKDIGFGANLDIGFGLDKLIDEYTASLSGGRSAYGTIKDTNKFSIGGSLEAQLGAFVLGTGIDYKSKISETKEQILDASGNILKSNENSVSDGKVFGKVYGGVEVPLGDNWKLGLVGGYNWNDGGFLGIRGGYKIK